MIVSILSDVVPYLLIALAIVGGVLGYGATRESAGKKKAEDKMEEKDNENAADIRDRADNVSVRDHDNDGWRD